MEYIGLNVQLSKILHSDTVVNHDNFDLFYDESIHKLKLLLDIEGVESSIINFIGLHEHLLDTFVSDAEYESEMKAYISNPYTKKYAIAYLDFIRIMKLMLGKQVDFEEMSSLKGPYSSGYDLQKALLKTPYYKAFKSIDLKSMHKLFDDWIHNLCIESINLSLGIEPVIAKSIAYVLKVKTLRGQYKANLLNLEDSRQRRGYEK